jgi:hypothetical protein
MFVRDSFIILILKRKSSGYRNVTKEVQPIGCTSALEVPVEL